MADKVKYWCKWCGRPYASVRDLTAGTCTKSPTRYCQLYEGAEKDKYTCKNCGRFYSSIQQMTGSRCGSTPGKFCEPAL